VALPPHLPPFSVLLRLTKGGRPIKACVLVLNFAASADVTRARKILLQDNLLKCGIYWSTPFLIWCVCQADMHVLRVRCKYRLLFCYFCLAEEKEENKKKFLKLTREAQGRL
jgi:hypothetical protein